jgi:PAS domain S-box-containing protein
MMIDKKKTESQLISELEEMRQRIADLEKSEAECAQKERALRESEEKLLKISEATFEGIAIHDKGKILEATQTLADMFGYELSDVIGMNGVDLVAPEHRDQVLEKILSAHEEPYEAMCLRKDGTTFICRIRGKPIRYKGRDVRITALRDITERKKAEEALKERERFLGEILDSIQDGISILDKDLQVIRVNSTMEKWYAHQMPLVGRKCYEVYHGRKKACEICPSLQTLDSGKPAMEIVHFAGEEGVKGWLELYTFPHVDSTTGQMTGVIEYVRDITERKLAEAKLKLLADELKRSNQELSQFASVAAHDLQSPLVSLASSLKLLRRHLKDKLDPEADEFITRTQEKAEDLQRLIRNLLDYSSVDRRSKKFKLLDCQAILDKTVANLKVDIQDSDAKITHDPLPEVLGNSTLLVQLFQNLIVNAIKFRGEEPPRIHISVDKKERECLFSFRDNGIGIDPKYAGRIFEIFQRLHEKGVYTGSGIGLATCKKIVELHGGNIWVESEPGKGSTFSFTIPSE